MSAEALPETWSLMTLNDLVQARSDMVDGPFGSNLKSSHYVDAGARVVRLQNIGYGSFVPGDAFISRQHFASLVKHEVVEGDLLFASLGEDLPRACLAPAFPEQAVVKADCIRVRLGDGVNPKFALYATLRPAAKLWASDKVHGMGRPRLGLGAIREFPVPVAPLPEQERIVEVLEEQLSCLDSALASITTVRTKADQFRRSLLHAAFTGALTGHAPGEWPIETLNDLVASRSDIVDGPFGSNLKSAHYVGHGARVVRLQNIGFGDFVAGDAFITLEHFQTLAKHNVAEGDLLFASLGENLPRACLAPRFGEPAIVKADCIRVRLRADINPRFVLHATQRPEARHWASEALHGMGRPRLGLGTIRRFPVPLPSRPVQDQVVAEVEAQFSNLGAALDAADRAEVLCAALRRSLLHAAFTGKLTAGWRRNADV
ncbi:MAG: type restriction enzyme StySPI specificity protein [Acidimicrobiales bacterium]|nr:type restriction enzyme StySPI specificity protein [Acidimicrobiales bacterium]